MPLLSLWPFGAPLTSLDAGANGELQGIQRAKNSGFRPGWLEGCANPSCPSGWLHLWRKRTVPVFEDGWTCSPECTRARVRSAVAREMGGMEARGTSHRHRIPLGLLMLEHGWITQLQLRRALEAQRTAGKGRIGEWLVRLGAAEAPMIARALALQWSCPVLGLEGHDPASVSFVMPRLFVDAFGALPLRVSGTGRLNLGFEEALDPVLALALERMTGLRVESGILPEAHFRPAHAQMLEAKFPSVELVEAVSESAAAHALARSIERTDPIAARLVRVHECLWLRMWLSPQSGPLLEVDSVRDVVSLIGAS